jgi:hypothetical protein
MSSALDAFRAQQVIAEQIHVRLGEVAVLLERLNAQVDRLVLDKDLRAILAVPGCRS